MRLRTQVHGTVLAVLGHEYAHAVIPGQHLLGVLHSFLWNQGIDDCLRHWAPVLTNVLVQVTEVLNCSNSNTAADVSAVHLSVASL